MKRWSHKGVMTDSRHAWTFALNAGWSAYFSGVLLESVAKPPRSTNMEMHDAPGLSW